MPKKKAYFFAEEKQKEGGGGEKPFESDGFSIYVFPRQFRVDEFELVTWHRVGRYPLYKQQQIFPREANGRTITARLEIYLHAAKWNQRGGRICWKISNKTKDIQGILNVPKPFIYPTVGVKQQVYDSVLLQHVNTYIIEK